VNHPTNEISAIHAAITNMLIGTFSGSIMSSVYNIITYIGKINQADLFKPKCLVAYSTFLIYYALLLIAYKDLFRLYAPQSAYTTEVIPRIDAKSPGVKHANYSIMFAYLVLFAYFAFFMMTNVLMFFILFAIISSLDLCMSWVVRHKIRKFRITIRDEKFNKYLEKWFSGDLSFLFMSILFATTQPHIQRYYGDHINLLFLLFFLGIIILFCTLSAAKNV
jgi:hypothetical protein